MEGREGERERERGLERERLFQSVIYAFSRIGACSDCRYFGVLRLLIYDKAGREGQIRKVGMDAIKHYHNSTPSLKLPPPLWYGVVPRDCENEWMRRSLAPPLLDVKLWAEKLGKRDGDLETWSCFSETQIPSEPRGPGLCRMCPDNFIRRKTCWQKHPVLE